MDPSRPQRGVRRDILAGLSLASMTIPQVLGYTRIAGTPLVTGLYTALLPVVAFAAFGASRHMVVAADSATAAIFSGGLRGLAEPYSAHYLQLAGAVALLAAALLLLARLFKLGFLADFLSRTVLVGFLAGVGLQVGIAMLGDMLGLKTAAHLPWQQLAELAAQWPPQGWDEAALSAVALALLWAGKRFAPRLPAALLLVIGAIAASAAFGFEARGIAVLGAVAGGLPPLGLPEVSTRELLALLPVAVSCVIVIVAQSAATARSFAQRHGETEDFNRDLVGLAAANAAAACSGAFVVNGSPTQTATAEAVGAHSQLAQLTFAAVTLLVLLWLTPALAYLPRCVLATLVFSIALHMIDLRSLSDIRRESPGECGLALLTAAAVVGLGVELGILLAMGLSLLRHVRHSYAPHSGVLVRDAAGEWQVLPCREARLAEPGLLLYRFGADLFYANERRFADELRGLAERAGPGLRALVVDASAIADLDYSAARMLLGLITELRSRGINLVFGRASPGLQADMQRHGIIAALGPQHLHASLHAALADAREAQA
ncbi:MAG TPA: SulP family inorganic anion transporter [Rubrivivax sp.]|nr:SulP family inorganic anion transporter [Rubrivivax sp.]